MGNMTTTTRPMTASTSATSKTRGRGSRARGGSVRALGVPSALTGIAHLHTTAEIFRRGVAIYTEGRVSSTLYDHIFHVAGGGAFYRVDLSEPSCGCAWWENHSDARMLQVGGPGG
jgi:hypothetical protein